MASTTAIRTTPVQEGKFQTGRALPILVGHFIHDTFTSAVAPLLPLLIEKLSLSLTAAGMLSAVTQIPGILNPLIGYMADRFSVRFFVIFAPAVTATLVSLIGIAPSYASLLILLLAVGVSTACFHAPAPPMVARVSGRRVGLGMSLFMVAGEGAYTVGPLLVMWAVSQWTLEGIWRLMFLGWGATLMLLWRLNKVEARPEKVGNLRAVLPAFWSLFLPMAVFSMLRNPLVESISTYLPTYMTQRGAGMWLAGASLSLVQGMGVVGALIVGAYSDRMGRKRLLMAAQAAAGILLAIFVLWGRGIWAGPLLLALGFTGFAATPLLLVIVQEQFPDHRATANGFYMLVNFFLRPIGTLLVGFLGDRLGLDTTYLIAAGLAVLSLPAIRWMPDK